MIEIVNRWTRVAVYRSEKAENISQAAREALAARAVLTGADLTGADLTGADLRGAVLMRRRLFPRGCVALAAAAVPAHRRSRLAAGVAAVRGWRRGHGVRVAERGGKGWVVSMTGFISHQGRKPHEGGGDPAVHAEARERELRRRLAVLEHLVEKLGERVAAIEAKEPKK